MLRVLSTPHLFSQTFAAYLIKIARRIKMPLARYTLVAFMEMLVILVAIKSPVRSSAFVAALAHRTATLLTTMLE